MDDVKKSLYESFNARNLNPKEIAKNFVPNEFYDMLRGNNHVVIMGPRGSGKTTMLKMLTLEALSSWDDARAKKIASEMPFTAVYIPTDIHWHRQLEYSVEQLQRFADQQQRFPNIGQIFSAASVTTNILTALTLAMKDRLQYEIKNTNLEQEAKLCRELFKGWMLPLEVPSLGALLQALKMRISDIRIWHSKFTHEDPERSKTYDLPGYFHLDYLAAVDFACTAFDEVFCKDKKIKWALCFDELEIAPIWLQDRLFSELRSTEEKLLFKLSTSPIPFSDKLKASARNDFSLIQLWPHSRIDFSSFSEQLARMILRKHGVELSPYEYFGASPFSDKNSASVDEYAQNSFVWKAIKSEAVQDASLRKILEANDISPENPTTKDVKKRDSVLRKMKPIVLYRAAYRKITDAGTTSARSRKNVSELFSGFDAISTMSEGNPRWLIGILEDMLLNSEKNINGNVIAISAEKQSFILMRASEHFYTLIKSLPESKETVNNQDVYLVDFLERIADFFFAEQILSDFKLDPIGSFKVDENAPPGIIKLLRKASYHGAVILINPNEASLDADLTGKRFRLGYMLAPYLRLPLRLYDDVLLIKCILGKTEKGQMDLL